MKQIGIFIISSLCFFSCSNEETEVAGNGEDVTNTLTVSYTIPDTEAATRTDGSTRTGNACADRSGSTRADLPYVTATADENKIDNLYLLFFKPDEHNNGAYVGRATVTPPSNTINLQSNTVTVPLPTGNVKVEDEYSVLAIANLAALLDGPGNGTTNTDAYLNTFATKTYAQAWEELQASLPLAAPVTRAYDGTRTYNIAGRLPMSGTSVKPAGSSALNVDLLRASVRIDIKIADFVTGVTLTGAQLGNVSTVVPLFRTQEKTTAARAFSKVSPSTDNKITAQLYAVETSLDVSDRRTLLEEATCLLINIKAPGNVHTAGSENENKTWYRVNLNVTDGNQFLKRNNAYTVLITGIYSPGGATPEEAYYDKATLIDAVTIPVAWTESGVTTPEVEL